WEDDGLVKRETHAVLLQQHTAAEPGVGLYFKFGANHVLHVLDYHRRLPPNFKTWAPELTPFSCKTCATLRSIISRPFLSWSSGMVSAGSTFSTSSLAPEVSMTRPCSNALRAN